MAKKPSVTTVASGYQGTAAINSNFSNIRDAFDNTLSLDGSTPNAMLSDFDVNSNDIINANNIYANDVLIDGLSFQGVLSGAYSLLYPGLGVDFTDNTVMTVAATGTTDGDKGDITVSSSGAVWTINAGAVTYSMLDSTATSAFAAASHNHDDRYFTESEVTTLLSGKSDTGHTHDDRYYTEAEVTSFLSGKANTSHTHAASDITSGTLAIARGGTNLSSTPTNGQVLIGNGTGYTLANITAGPNVTITNSAGGISISAATTGGATLADGDYGDVVVSGTGTVMTIDTGAVSTTKLGGDITTAGKALLDDADAAAQRTTLGLGTMATQTAANYATLSSPTFTDTPAAPTATAYTNTTQIATTASVYNTVTTVPENAQTGTTYTLVLADAGKLVSLSNASAITLTIPTNASVAFPTNTRIDLLQYGAGQVTVGGAGVTIRSSGSKLKLTGQYSGATLWKKGTDEWVLIGDITT